MATDANCRARQAVSDPPSIGRQLELRTNAGRGRLGCVSTCEGFAGRCPTFALPIAVGQAPGQIPVPHQPRSANSNGAAPANGNRAARCGGGTAKTHDAVTGFDQMDGNATQLLPPGGWSSSSSSATVPSSSEMTTLRHFSTTCGESACPHENPAQNTGGRGRWRTVLQRTAPAFFWYAIRTEIHLAMPSM